jgi:rhodanese-related sulfurtransferase
MIYKNFLIFIIIFTTVFGCKESVAQEQVKLISPKEMQKLIEIDSVQLIDVRTPSEFNEGHLDNAKNIDFLSPSFSKDISALDKTKPVYIYCHSGNRSGKSVKVFLNAGFTKIYDLDGGISSWRQEGFLEKK